MEPLLADEIRRIAPEATVAETVAGVSVSAGPGAFYRFCIASRLAGRVFVELAAGPVGNPDELYGLARGLAWHRHLGVDHTFAVSAVGRHRAFGNLNIAALRVKDAVADHFRERLGRRPSVDADNPDLALAVRLDDNRAIISVEISGGSLHRRGYRTERTEAPLRENTAAAVLVRSGWAAALAQWRAVGGSAPFLADPMCGSGTLAIEAAMMATDTPPGMLRGPAAPTGWLGFDTQLWTRLADEAAQTAVEETTRFLDSGGVIFASDLDPAAVDIARANADRAGMTGVIRFSRGDFLRMNRGAVVGKAAAASPGGDGDSRLFLVTNPPHGRRLSPGGESEVFHSLGKVLAERYRGFTAAVLAADDEQTRLLGLRASRIYRLYNGALPVVLCVLDLDESNRYRDPDSHVVADETAGVPSIVNRIGKNLNAIADLARDEGLGAYRIYDADIPQYAAAVDLYHLRGRNRPLAVVAEYQAPRSVDARAAESRFRDLLRAVTEACDVDEKDLVVKKRRRQSEGRRYDAGLDEVRVGSRPAAGVVGLVAEGGFLFEVNLTDYLDTGLFLDHRALRRRLAGRCRPGTRFLNLFAYTCTASVYAAAAGARTVSVDSSATYLDWGRRNFRANRIAPEGHSFVRRDVLEFLVNQAAIAAAYDLIFIDPPSFSNSKSRSGDFDVQADHARLIRRAGAVLDSAGLIVFSTNLRRFRLDASLADDFEIADIADETIAADFARRASRRHVWELRPKS